jgi:hypothetical protein
MNKNSDIVCPFCTNQDSRMIEVVVKSTIERIENQWKVIAWTIYICSVCGKDWRIKHDESKSK